MSNRIPCNWKNPSSQRGTPVINSTSSVDSNCTGCFLQVETPSNITVTMPDATTSHGACYGFVRVNDTTGSLTIDTVSSQTITIFDITNGSVSGTSISSPAGAAQLGGIVRVMSDGANWFGIQVAAGNWS